MRAPGRRSQSVYVHPSAAVILPAVHRVHHLQVESIGPSLSKALCFRRPVCVHTVSQPRISNLCSRNVLRLKWCCRSLADPHRYNHGPREHRPVSWRRPKGLHPALDCQASDARAQHRRSASRKSSKGQHPAPQRQTCDVRAQQRNPVRVWKPFI